MFLTSSSLSANGTTSSALACRMTVPGFTDLAVTCFLQAGQSRTSLAFPPLMFMATAPPRLEPTTAGGRCLSNSAWAIFTASSITRPGIYYYTARHLLQALKNLDEGLLDLPLVLVHGKELDKPNLVSGMIP